MLANTAKNIEPEGMPIPHKLRAIQGGLFDRSGLIRKETEEQTLLTQIEADIEEELRKGPQLEASGAQPINIEEFKDPNATINISHGFIVSLANNIKKVIEKSNIDPNDERALNTLVTATTRAFHEYYGTFLPNELIVTALMHAIGDIKSNRSRVSNIIQEKKVA